MCLLSLFLDRALYICILVFLQAKFAVVNESKLFALGAAFLLCRTDILVCHAALKTFVMNVMTLVGIVSPILMRR